MTVCATLGSRQDHASQLRWCQPSLPTLGGAVQGKVRGTGSVLREEELEGQFSTGP